MSLKIQISSYKKELDNEHKGSLEFLSYEIELRNGFTQMTSQFELPTRKFL